MVNWRFFVVNRSKEPYNLLFLNSIYFQKPEMSIFESLTLVPIQNTTIEADSPMEKEVRGKV